MWFQQSFVLVLIMWQNRLMQVNPAVLKLGAATLFRMAKCSLKVAKVYQDCHITLDLLLFCNILVLGKFWKCLDHSFSHNWLTCVDQLWFWCQPIFCAVVIHAVDHLPNRLSNIILILKKTIFASIFQTELVGNHHGWKWKTSFARFTSRTRFHF